MQPMLFTPQISPFSSLSSHPDTFLEPAAGGAGAEEALRRAAGRAQEQDKGAGARERAPCPALPAEPLSQGPTHLGPRCRAPRRPRQWPRPRRRQAFASGEAALPHGPWSSTVMFRHCPLARTKECGVAAHSPPATPTRVNSSHGIGTLGDPAAGGAGTHESTPHHHQTAVGACDGLSRPSSDEGENEERDETTDKLDCHYSGYHPRPAAVSIYTHTHAHARSLTHSL